MRILYERLITDNKKYIEAAGLSTDTKPTTGIVTGSIFWECDASTGAWTAYMYEETSGKWTDREGNEG